MWNKSDDVHWLHAVLADSSRDSLTRVAALNTLTRKEGPAAYPRLIEALSDGDATVVEAAGVLLFEIGPAVLPILCAAMLRSDTPRPENLVRILGRIGTPAAVGPLCQALNAPSRSLRKVAAQVLGEQGLTGRNNADLVEPLTFALCSAAYPRVRAAAALALGACHRREAAPILRARLRPLLGERDSFVLPFIRSALQQIERATDELASRPIPSHAPEESLHLPLPATGTANDPRELPLPAPAECTCGE